MHTSIYYWIILGLNLLLFMEYKGPIVSQHNN
jgi:hypothetical protein